MDRVKERTEKEGWMRVTILCRPPLFLSFVGFAETAP